MSQASQQAIPHYAGHRERLREKFLTAGPGSFQDYELLELLLFTAIPRRDVKPLAKELLREFNCIWNLTHADPRRLREFGLGDTAITLLLSVGTLALRSQRQEISSLPVLNNWQRVMDYCHAAMVHENKEQFRVLYLNRRNILLLDEVHQTGTIDHAAVYPREIIKRALELGAGALVLAHNHPSGDNCPSKADIDLTRAIVAACQPLGIAVHDHLIVGKNDVASFKSLGLL